MDLNCGKEDLDLIWEMGVLNLKAVEQLDRLLREAVDSSIAVSEKRLDKHVTRMVKREREQLLFMQGLGLDDSWSPFHFYDFKSVFILENNCRHWNWIYCTKVNALNWRRLQYPILKRADCKW